MKTKTISIALCWLAAVGAFADFGWVPKSLRDSSVFEEFQSDDLASSEFLAVRRRSDSVEFRACVRNRPAGRASAYPPPAAAPSYYESETLTGNPLGFFTVVGANPGHAFTCGLTPYEEVIMIANSPQGFYPGRPGVPRPDNLKPELPMLESYARESMAKFASRRLEQAGTVDVGGAKVASYTAKGSGAVLVDLAAWAKAKGYALNLNAKEFRASVSTPSGAALVCAASPKSKLGDKWVPMPDIAMLKDGKLWTPYAFLKGL